MIQRKILILLAVFVVAFMFAGAASAASVQSNQITTAKNPVGINTGQNVQQKSKINDPVNLRTLKSYGTIQAAINDPKTLNGDTIVVLGGVYTENVLVNKALILLGKGTVMVQAADPTLPIFSITSNKVTIQNFNINGATESDGILVQSNGNTIRDNTITNNYNGILVQNARSNNIKNNQINNNANNGIELDNSNSNFMTSNTVSNNGGAGISLINSNFNTIANNYASNDPNAGIVLNTSNFNTINGNTVPLSGGLLLWLSNNNALTNNIVTDTQTWPGIELYTSNNNALIGNTVTGSADDGLLLGSSSNNYIQGNNITDNIGYGLHFISSSSNTVTNNDLTSNTAGDRNIDGTSLNNIFSGNNPAP